MKMYLLEKSAEMSTSFHQGILKVITPSKVKELGYIYIILLKLNLLSTCHVKGTPKGQTGDNETDAVSLQRSFNLGEETNKNNCLGEWVMDCFCSATILLHFLWKAALSFKFQITL